MKTIKEEMNYIMKRNDFYHSLMDYAKTDGFIQVESDLFEGVFDFIESNDRFDIKSLIKLEDKNGEIYILRPDITTNIIKQVIPRMTDDDFLKLFYLDNVYAYGQGGQMKASRQFGVEMIGGDAYKKEEELFTFIEGLLNQYQMSYEIEIGNQLFIDILIGEMTDNRQVKTNIKDALMKKNIQQLRQALDMDNLYAKLLIMLLEPNNDIISIKTFIESNELNTKLIDEINRTLTMIENINQSNITIDLSLISPYDYYNGPIFKGYIKGYPNDVFRGGRYDTLTKKYGRLTKALGFSLDIGPFMKEVLRNE